MTSSYPASARAAFRRMRDSGDLRVGTAGEALCADVMAEVASLASAVAERSGASGVHAVEVRVRLATAESVVVQELLVSGLASAWRRND